MNVKKAKDYLDKLNKNWLGGGYIILTFGITSETTKKKKKDYSRKTTVMESPRRIMQQ